MYARDLSTRDIEDDLIEATGDVILSKSAVSNITEALYEDFEEFQGRDLSCFEVEYLFLDAIYEILYCLSRAKGYIALDRQYSI